MRAEARTTLFLLAMAAPGLAGCTGPVDARALDRICGARLDPGPACEIHGVGLEIPGPTDDSVGFSLQDAGLIVHLTAVQEMRAPGPFDLSLLTSASRPATSLDTTLTWGPCSAGCPADPPLTVTELPAELAWVTVASGVHGSAADAKIPYDAVVTFTAVDVVVIDLRVTATP